MPPEKQYTRDFLLSGAITLVKTQGWEALTVRNLARSLGLSTFPILQHFSSLEILKREVQYALMAEVQKIQRRPFTDLAYLNLFIGYVIYAWREPLAFLALRDLIMKAVPRQVDEEIEREMRISPRYRQATVQEVIDARVKMTVFSHGLADFAARGLLHEPSEEGIARYLTACLETLTKES